MSIFSEKNKQVNNSNSRSIFGQVAYRLPDIPKPDFTSISDERPFPSYTNHGLGGTFGTPESASVAYDYVSPYKDNPDYLENSKYRSTKKNTEEKGGLYNLLHPNGMTVLPGGGFSANTSSEYEDDLYEYINRNKDVVGKKTLEDISNGSMLGGVDESYLQYMTDGEIGDYNYLYSTKGKDAADQFLKDRKKELTSRQMQEKMETVADYSRNDKFGASVFSVLQGPANVLSAIGQLADYGYDNEIDPNAGYNQFIKTQEKIRSTVPENASDFGKFMYSTGMAAADNLYNMLITGSYGDVGGLGQGAEKIVQMIMSSTAASSKTLEKLENGYSSERAIITGLVAGVAAWLGEHVNWSARVSPNAFLDSPLKYIAKGGLTEGLEEGYEDILNWGADFIGDLVTDENKSDLYEALAYYRDGKTEEGWNKLKDMGAEAALDMAAGALSGMMLSGGASAVNIGNRINNGRIFKNEAAGTNDVSDFASDFAADTAADPRSTAYQERLSERALEQLSRSGKVNNYTLGSMMQNTYYNQQMIEQGTDILNEALNTLRQGKDIRSSDVNDILDNPYVTDYLRDNAGLRLSEGMLREDKQQAVKTSVNGLLNTLEEADGPRRRSVNLIESFASGFGSQGEKTLKAIARVNGYKNTDAMASSFTTIYNASKKDPEVSLNELTKKTPYRFDPDEASLIYESAIADKEAELRKTGIPFESTYEEAENGEETGNEDLNAKRERLSGLDYAKERITERRKSYTESRQDALNRRESIENNAAIRGIEEVTSKEANFPGGIETDDARTVKVIPKKLWSTLNTDTYNLTKELEKEGYEVMLYAGNALVYDEMSKGNTLVNGFNEGNRIGVRLDGDLSPRQIIYHELFHTKVKSDSKLQKAMVEKLYEKYGEARVKALVKDYVNAYKFEDASDEDILNEILADAYGGIDIYDHLASYEGATQFTEDVREGVKEAEAEGNGTRAGPDDFRFSRETDKDKINASTIKEQLKESLAEILERGNIYSVNYDIPGKTQVKARIDHALDVGKKWGYQFERKGFGSIVFDEKRIRKAFDYGLNDAEIAAFEAIPYVIRRGVQLEGHDNHKGRGYQTATFAAQVQINGKPYVLGVTVKQTNKNYYNVHRAMLLSEDQIGSVRKEAVPTPGDGSSKELFNSPISTASDNRIADKGENVNTSFSRSADLSEDQYYDLVKEVYPEATDKEARIAAKGLEEIALDNDDAQIRTIALGIRNDLVKKGFVDFRGKKLDANPKKAAAQLASYAQVLRSPNFETFRVFYLKDNVIVGHEAVTSYLTSASRFTKKTNWEDAVKDFKDRMHRLGADGYYLMHNHPSGDVSYSRPDLTITNGFNRYIPGLRGSIILDHNEFGFFDVTGNFTKNPVKSDVDFNDRVIDHPLLYRIIDSPEEIAKTGKSLVHSDTYSALVFSGNAGIRAIQEVNNSFVRSKDFFNFVKNRKLEFGSPDAFLVTSNKTVFSSWDIAEALRKNIFRDVVDATTGKTHIQSGWEQDPHYETNGVRGSEVGAFRVAEDTVNDYVESAKAASSVNPKREELARKTFGTTYDFREAGYLMRNGSMLDFSGKRDGGQPHQRSMDHRDVSEIFGEGEIDESKTRYGNASAYMNAFIAEGNIRLMDGQGVTIGELEPTAKQYTVLKKFIDRLLSDDGYFYLDLSNDDGDTVESREYEEPATSSEIIREIKAYFKNGELPYRSDLQQFRYSRDASYLKAVNSGKTEEVMRLVEEAARDAGYDTRAYHGTPNGTFNVFRDWTYFTQDRSYADQYQSQGASVNYKRSADNPRTYDVFVKPENAFDTRKARDRKIFENEFYGKWGNGAPLSERGLPDWTDGDDLIEFFEENGYDYDAIYLDEGGTGGYGEEVKDRGISIVIKNSSQIKSADPVTYDDEENIIPLSERFNEKNEDIRFSRDLSKTDIEKENEKLKKQLAEATKRYQYYKGQLTLTKRKTITEASAKKVARDIIKEFQSTASEEALVRGITKAAEVFYNANNDSDIDEIYDVMKSIVMPHAKDIIMNTRGLVNPEEAEIRKRIMDGIKNGSGIIVTDKMKAEIPDYNAWRKSKVGTLKLVNGARTNIEPMYEELRSEFGAQYFPEDITDPADMLIHLSDVIEDLRAIYDNPYTYGGADAAEAVEWCADEIIKDYMFDQERGVEEKPPTFADKQLELRNQEKKEAVRKKEEALKRLREERDKAIASQADHYRHRINSIYDKRRQYELRVQIRKTAKEMSDTLLKPTDKKHIPAALEGAVIDILSSINTSSAFDFDPRAYGQRVPQGEGVPTSKTSAYLRLKEQLTELKGQLVLDEDLFDSQETTGILTEIALYPDTSIDALNTEQLEKVYMVLQNLQNAVRTWNKTFNDAKWQEISQAGEALYLDNMKKKGRIQYADPIEKTVNLVTVDMLTPEAYFRRLGDSGSSLFKMLRKAQDTNIRILKEAQEYSEENGLYKLRLKDYEDKTLTVSLGGKDVEMTKAQLMELYILNKRDAARAHIEVGGILPEAAKKKGSLKKVSYNEPVRNLTQQDIANAVSQLTKEDILIAEAMQRFVSTTLTNYGNEASMRVYGYKKFGDENYWPIRVNEQDLHADLGAVRQRKKTVSTKGFTNLVKPNAKQSVIIGSIFDTYTEHVAEMANYAAYLATMEDMKRIYNFKEYERNGAIALNTKYTLQNVFGQNGTKYFEKLMEDLSNGMISEQSYFGGLIGRFKAAAVGSNLRVIVQQPTAIFRSMDMIDPKYLIKGIAKFNKGAKKAVQNAPIAQWKDWGYFDLNTGRSTKNILFENSSTLDKVQNVLMSGAGKADSVAWGALYSAVEEETKDLRKDLDPRSNAFNEYVAERFSEIVDHSQVVDGVLQRSGIMRSTNAIDKMATSFMAEPTKQFNMLGTAIYDMVHSTGDDTRRKAAGALARTVSAMLFAGVLNAAMQSIVDGLRNDDPEKRYLEKFLASFTGDEKTFASFMSSNLGDFVNPAQYIPYAKDLVSIIQGYDVERMDMSLISDLYADARSMVNAFSGKGKYSLVNNIMNFTNTVARFFGLSVGNVKRDVAGIVNTIAEETGSYVMMYDMAKFTYNMNQSTNKGRFVEILAKAYENDREAFNIILEDMIREDKFATSTMTTREWIVKRLKDNHNIRIK